MNYFRILEGLTKLVKSGQIKSIDEALAMLQRGGAKIDGILRQGVINIFKKGKARDPDFGTNVTKMSIDDAGIPYNPKTLKSTLQKRGTILNEADKRKLWEMSNDVDGPIKNLYDDFESFSEVYDLHGKERMWRGVKKSKKGVESLFEETKKVNMPAEKLNHQMIADQAGIDVELIKGKDWVEILEVLKGLKKADGGRIGFNQGGSGWEYEPMFTKNVGSFTAPIGLTEKEIPSRIGQTFTDDTQQAFRVGNIASNTGITDPKTLINISDNLDRPFNVAGSFGLQDSANKVADKYAKQGISSDYRHALGTSAFKDSIIDYLGSNLGIDTQSGILDTIGSIGAKGATIIEEGGDALSALDQYYRDKKGDVGINNPELFNLTLSEILAQPKEDFTANWFAADQIPFGTSPLEKMKMIQAYRKYGKDHYAQQLENQKKAAMQEKIRKAEAAASAAAQVRANIQRYGSGDRPNTGINTPGSGKGQSPTGGDVQGTPFAQGGRIGFEVGGLSEQAQSIYDSWIDAGHSEEDVLAYLESRGLYNAPVIQEGIMTAPNIINQNLGGNGNDGGTTINPYDPNQNLGPNKNITDYEADAEGLGPTWRGQFARLKNAFGNIPTPFNIVRMGIQKAQDWTDQRRIEKEKAAAEAFQKQLDAAYQQYGGQDSPSGGGGRYDGASSKAEWSADPTGYSGSFKKGGVATMFTRRR